MINEIDTNKNKENAEEKETVTNQSLNIERIEEKKEQNPIIPISNEKLPEIKEKSKGTKIFSVCDYIIYKITFGKKSDYLETYENFYKQIISVENLIQNYLSINNLMELGRENKK